MHIIATILEGFFVGLIAKLIMPGRDPKGFIITILLGIGGALLAGWAGRALGFYGPGQSAGFIASVIGAIILLIPYHIYERSKIKNP
jgi:uncharacterized membrane protein YeaQ/YmgE (transglycosylase-associated protein family)